MLEAQRKKLHTTVPSAVGSSESTRTLLTIATALQKSHSILTCASIGISVFERKRIPLSERSSVMPVPCNGPEVDSQKVTGMFRGTRPIARRASSPSRCFVA